MFHLGGRSRGVGLVLSALLVCAAATAAVALAATDSLGNGYISHSYGPYRSTLNRVFVHDQDGHGACEDTLDTNGNSVQENPYCTTGSVYHDFCACATRRGEIFASGFYLPGGTPTSEYMDGHQDY